MRRAGWTLLVAVLLAGLAPTHAAPLRYQGRPLAEALLSLQKQGLTIVFTSQLVRPEMKVAREPAACEPRRILDEILAPHGLEVEEGPGGVLVVVAVAKRGGQEAVQETVAAPAPEDIPPPVFRDEILVQPSRLSLFDEQPEPSLSLGREEIETLPHLGRDVFRVAPPDGRQYALGLSVLDALASSSGRLARDRGTDRGAWLLTVRRALRSVSKAVCNVRRGQ